MIKAPRTIVGVALLLSNLLSISIVDAIPPASVEGSEIPGPTTYNFESSQRVGAKGELRYPYSNEPLRCGKPMLVFDHAQIVFRQRRFGDAQIISTPSPGCTHCEPVVVRWYHEPTGRLDFQVQIYHRRVVGPCKDNVLSPDSSLTDPRQRASHEYGIPDLSAKTHTDHASPINNGSISQGNEEKL